MFEKDGAISPEVDFFHLFSSLVSRIDEELYEEYFPSILKLDDEVKLFVLWILASESEMNDESY